MKRIALGAALATVASAALAENPIDRIRPDAPALAAYGDHKIGVTTLTFTRKGVADVVNATAETVPTYDRALTVEVWYPAADSTEEGTTYATVLRDGTTATRLTGRAARDAAPAADGPFPLVIVSHGYPGNRFLMSPLAENVASKGYVVAAIDHTESTYSDLSAFASTLVNRPLDQAFVLDSMATLDGPVGSIVDGDSAAVIGYSMGGYGALIFAGGGLSPEIMSSRFAPAQDLLAVHQSGSASHDDLPDDRVKAVVAIGPWGRNWEFWEGAGLGAIEKPLMLIAGGVDDVSDYAAMRRIFDETTGTERHLLTFENANHNAAAPMPAPDNSWPKVESLGYAPFEHYADAVWDTVRMNNITQHFVTAYLDLHLKGIADRATYLELTPKASDGRWSMSEEGVALDDHTYWAGFGNRTAVGLQFETRAAGE
ncbi:dienelactone hydrolase [Phaeobacter sp. B1627]|uniref:alpha/beta hydrolase family protein n=1 Tax=Phaeobacter sp. B1627 TaxID=2583809 RepID=UPI00111B9D45|nr:dienelactone hydrolase [Phaeobacter sp. B1627]TNJ40168.1 dienelactone hydrolase [Phaeobacter sp. B1627]